jgi:hypothetical protein
VRGLSILKRKKSSQVQQFTFANTLLGWVLASIEIGATTAIFLGGPPEDVHHNRNFRVGVGVGFRGWV